MAAALEPAGFSFFYHFICHTCKSCAKEVKSCAGCRLVSYCSVEHQKSDWRRHKDICKCIQGLLKKWNVPNIFGVDPKTVDEWRHVRLSLISCVEQHMPRPMSIDEKQFFYFANVCKVCFSTKLSKEYMCEQCKVICYCSKEHKDQHIDMHLLECSDLKTCYVTDRLCSELKINPQRIEKNFDIPFFDKKSFPRDIMSYLNEHSRSENPYNILLLSEAMSGPLSMMFSIFSCKKMNFASKETIIVHILGSSVYEQSFIRHIELLFHCMPCLKELNITLIGPDDEGEIYKSDVSLCDECKTKKFYVFSNRSLYHEFTSSPEFKKPDLIVAFNCGYSEFSKTNKDTWKATLSHIVGLKDVLFMFTSYTKNESMEDFSIVNGLIPSDTKDSIYFNKISSDNPFRSHRPHRDWEETEKSIFYLNNYLSIIEIGS